MRAAEAPIRLSGSAHDVDAIVGEDLIEGRGWLRKLWT
ncbi:UNVERIFIED_ORG: hypothetical protein ABIB21_002868 [Arthrobacter sp. UYEF13]